MDYWLTFWMLFRVDYILQVLHSECAVFLVVAIGILETEMETEMERDQDMEMTIRIPHRIPLKKLKQTLLEIIAPEEKNLLMKCIMNYQSNIQDVILRAK